MYLNFFKENASFAITVMALNLFLIAVVDIKPCQASLLSELSTQLIGADLDEVLHLVLHLKEIKKTLDPIIDLLKTLLPILKQVSDILGTIDKIL